MSGGAAQVARLQSLLSALLDVPAAVPIGPHLMTREEHRRMPGANLCLPEQVFVGSAGLAAANEVAVSVYIAPAVLHHLAQDDPFCRLHAGNLESLCIALEGVSHFVMVAWRATWGLPVSALELEIQAEADKFVVALLLASRRAPTFCLDGRPLWRRLFRDAQWRPAVAAAERERYRLASAIAASFCGALLAGPRHPGPRRRLLVQAARRWFRRPLAAKLRASCGPSAECG